MPLPAPNLDDRRFQDILDEARRLIPRYCPEWTDHNLSDPGITLLELFSWMTDMMLYRLNRVPDKNYIKFLELIGVRLEAAKPAKADLTFRLTAAQPVDVLIPRGTSVGTLRTEVMEAITFETDEDLLVRVPKLTQVLAVRQGVRFHDYQLALADTGQRLGIFSDIPQEDDAFYLGFGNDLSSQTLVITLNCLAEGIGVDPTDPPLVWETWNGLDREWMPLKPEQDTTGGLNRDGLIIISLPRATQQTVVDDKLAMWLRCRVLRPRPGQTTYSDSPRILSLAVTTIGGTVPARHTFPVVGESLGLSDGKPAQRFQMLYPPIMQRRGDELLQVVDNEGNVENWVEVQHFGASGPEDPHYLIDDVSGTVELGPLIRTPNGEERQHGRVPPAGRTLRFTSYRSGGGLVGNVGARTLNVLKTPIPYVEWVTNFEAAHGGTDSEDLEHAKWRGPQIVRSRERAVTPGDFEYLAQEATSGVARVRHTMVGPRLVEIVSAESAPATAVSVLESNGANGHANGTNGTAEHGVVASGTVLELPRRGEAPRLPAGVVRLLLVPQVPQVNGPMPIEDLQVPQNVLDAVQGYLDERRLLTTEVVLDIPEYAWVTVLASVKARPEANPTRVSYEAAEALYRFLHPTLGGLDGRGWPFGRELFAGDIHSLLLQLEDVQYVEDVVLQEVDPVLRRFGPASQRITLGPDALLCSFEHRVSVTPSLSRWT